MPFQREERYIVIKRKHLTPIQETALRAHIARLGVHTLECAVVEPDWPEYEVVWGLIEARCTDTETLPLFADLGDGVAQDDAFRDAVLHGTGAVRGRADADEAWRKQPQLPLEEVGRWAGRIIQPQNFLRFDAEELPDILMYQHGNIERQQDEVLCHRCGKRWGVDEPAPGCR